MSDKHDVGVVVAAAGGGRRFGGRKHFLQLADRPLLHYSLDAFAAVKEVQRIAVVFAPGDLETGREIIAGWSAGVAGGDGPEVDLVRGGARRQDSVVNGLEAFASSVKYVLVHDAARPLVRPGDIRRVLAAARRHGAATLGTPCHDSVKRAAGELIVGELPRDEIWTVQTPQSARADALREAYDRGRGREYTDEASALRAIGVSVALVEGSRENIKITHRGDEAMAELILRARRERP